MKKIPHCLPKDISPEVFLAEYWQKKPLLIKNGLPALVNLFDPEDVIALAQEEEVSARLITQTPTDTGDKWTLKYSPLTQKDFKHTPELWTVLVQNLEQWSVELGELWQAFDFIPKWQQDDIMVSYAPDGGSVGRHYDEYDVFLAQGYGKRRWQLGKMCDDKTEFIKGQPIRLLDDMGEIIFDEVLDAGDVLYVPPRLSHYGLAVGDCLTFSFGFRRPSSVQVLDKLADVATNHPALFKPLILPQAPQDSSHTLSHDSITAIKERLIAFLNSPEGDTLFCQAVSELVSVRQYELLAFDDEIDGEILAGFLTEDGKLGINHASRFIKVGEDWYINGEPVCLDDTALRLLTALLEGEKLGQDALKDADMGVLASWVNNNWLVAIEPDA
ncbi:MAG: cupin domain-containing protein [Moraxella sp.]|nr:cupin domain-containing protein [Moraxella sp.]